jgi:FkbM family methyltransferase
MSETDRDSPPPALPPMIAPLLLRSFADHHDEVFFVEIGANDGEAFDPLRGYVRRPGWRGLMVEPVPYVFGRLLANLGEVAGIELANVAIAASEGEATVHHLAADAEHPALPPWKDAIGSLDREHLLTGIAAVPEGEREALLDATTVPCLRFETLLAEYGVERVDLLLIDTEGADAEILESIDLARHRPRLLVFEHHHIEPERLARLRERLETLGYTLVTEGLDTWCLDTGPEDALSAAWRAAADSWSRR